jgi:hypothetical protein
MNLFFSIDEDKFISSGMIKDILYSVIGLVANYHFS